MEFHSLVDGKKLPEIYHFGFSGTHFEIFLSPTYWLQFVNATQQGTYYASNQGKAYAPPVISGGAFGQHGTANASHAPDGFMMCIRVPAFLKNPDDVTNIVTMRVLGHTLSSILFILNHLLHETDKSNEEVIPQALLQLFVIETYISHDLRQPHGAGLDLSLSPVARKFLKALGNSVCIDKAMTAMSNHHWNSSAKGKPKPQAWYGDFVVRLREHGVLHLNTRGDCACLGTIPREFGERGCYLSSHNVDTVFQQFNLLVGIAYIWQMVRNEVKSKAI